MQADMNQWYKDTKETTKLRGKLTFERIKTSNDWPKLKCKAAAVRHLLRYAKKLASDNNSGNTHDQRRLACCTILQRFYDICDNNERWLPQDELNELAEGARTFLGIYANLARESLIKKERAWKLTAKFHLYVHLCEVQAKVFGNPRFFWTYADEDLQRVMKGVALGCHPLNLAPMVLYKWMLAKFDSDVS